MSEFKLLERGRTNRKSELSAKRKVDNPLLIESMAENYRYLTPLDKYKFAMLVSRWHDKTQTRSPFGRA